MPMKEGTPKAKTRVTLTAVWGNDDASSVIKVSRRCWKEIRNGGEHLISASSWYEGRRYRVVWRLADQRVSIDGEDGIECVVDLPVSGLIVEGAKDI